MSSYQKLYRTMGPSMKINRFRLLFLGFFAIFIPIAVLLLTIRLFNWNSYTEIDFFTISKDTKLNVYEKMIKEYRKRQTPSKPTSKHGNLYQKRVETSHIDCGRVLRRDREYIRSITAANHRIPLIEDVDLDMDCEAVRFRIHPAEHLELKPLQHGIAFARIVYRDYEFIEKQVQVSFHPNNTFCFAVDKKAPDEFRSKMKRMGECIDNVIVLPDSYSYDSSGHNTNLAHYLCMEAALKSPKWNYFITQENHDVVVKSVYELERIYKILGGANDVGIGPTLDERFRPWFKFDPKSLKLFRNESGIPKKVLETSMKTTKSYKQASLSRAAVEWMVRTVDPMDFINQWNQSGHGSDEQWLSTFQANSQLGMPGHFVHDCLEQGQDTDQVTRMTKWHPGNQNREECSTRTIRHSICVQGIEDLYSVASMPNLMFNKMLPSFDYSIVECTAELLYNRTFLGQVDQELDENYYANMINVLYHKNHLQPCQDYQLNCTRSYKVWEYKALDLQLGLPD